MAEEQFKVMDQEAARAYLNEVGIEGSPRQIRRWFADRVLPVFKSPINGVLLIKKDRLLAYLEDAAANEQINGAI